MMDKIFEALFKLIQFPQLFENLGASKELSVSLSGLIGIILVVFASALFKRLADHYKNSKAARDLAPYFDYRKVKASRELFIPTRFQNASPALEEEPQFTHKFVAKNPLIPFFMKTVFNEKKESEKFYLVLGDSGMGKTTFMINLYMQYNSFFNFSHKYKIRLLPFGDARILDQIKKTDPKEVANTILLLDAFDEDQKLIPSGASDGLTDDERFRRRLDEIIETVRDFREVVITSRTQYFPGQENEPYELKVPRFDDKGFHLLAKLYLSPFDNREIKHYLNKKYGALRVWNWKKKQTAVTIVKNSPKLMVRPMLLGYIDFFTDDKKIYQSTYEIYETLVDKWLEREATKRKHLKDREKFKRDLYAYSRLVAVEIYRQRQQTDLLCLKKEAAIEIARINNLDLCDYEITGQSLLTRDVEGNWKFAHKSILEFFISIEVASDLQLWFGQNFDGMDMIGQLLAEKLPGMQMPSNFIFIKGGNFLMGSPNDEAGRDDNETQHQVKVGDFYMAKYLVSLAQFETFIKESNYITDADKDGGSFMWNGKEWNKKPDINWRCDIRGELQKDKWHPVIHVSWNDVSAYCEWLSKKLNKSFRLPTEAEWEYTCRAGTITPFHTGENLTTDQANYNGNYSYQNYPKGKYINKTMPVGSYSANRWGLFDMHGNVYEWCLDWYGKEYYNKCKRQGIVDNPQGPESGSIRVLRGGSWSSRAQSCRSAYRDYDGPEFRSLRTGFRLVFVP
jgi:formylglycine-generating enzyme required for sulfatase activity